MQTILTNLLEGRGTPQMIQDTIQKYRLSYSFDQFCLNYGTPNHPIVINPWSLFHILFHSNKTKKYSILPFLDEIPLSYQRYRVRTTFHNIGETFLPMDIVRYIEAFI